MTDDRKIQILLVEDNKDFAKLVQVYLQRYEKDRFVVTWRENHTDAMAELEGEKKFDVVLMDYFLPGMTGQKYLQPAKIQQGRSETFFHFVCFLPLFFDSRN